MIIRVQPDRQRAGSLKKTASISLERLKETDRARYPSNTLVDYYDIIRKLLEAINSLEGIRIKGDGAHQATIDHVCRNEHLSEADRIFLQEIREYRNRTSYEGFTIPPEYIMQNNRRIMGIISRLFRIVEDKLGDRVNSP